MKFIKFRDGNHIRADKITAVRLGDANVLVDFNEGNILIFDCETNEERNALAESIMKDINDALSE